MANGVVGGSGHKKIKMLTRRHLRKRRTELKQQQYAGRAQHRIASSQLVKGGRR